MELVKTYNIGKTAEFDLEKLNNDLEPGTYTIKTQGISKNGKKSPESEGVIYTVPGVRIGDYVYSTSTVGVDVILKAGDNLVDYDDESSSSDDNLYVVRNGKYYFSYKAINYLNENAETLFPGWHIPTKEELVDMFATKDITISSSYEEPTHLSDVEDDLKEILNQVGFDTTTWNENCVYNYTGANLVEDFLLCSNEFDSVGFSSYRLYWTSISDSTDYWPQLILCKNHD
jgi:hypothetical protein